MSVKQGPTLIMTSCFSFLLQGALYVLLNNRMLFLIVHYWEVMVDVWPAIVKVTVVTVLLQINRRSRLYKSPLFFFLVSYAILKDFSYLFSAKFTGRKFNR